MSFLKTFNLKELQLKTEMEVKDFLDKGDYFSAYSVLADYLAEVDLYNNAIKTSNELAEEFGKGLY